MSCLVLFGAGCVDVLNYAKEDSELNPVQVGLANFDLTGVQPFNDRNSMKGPHTLQFTGEGMVIWEEHTKKAPPYKRNEWRWFGFEFNTTEKTVEVKDFGIQTTSKKYQGKTRMNTCRELEEPFVRHYRFIDCSKGKSALIYMKDDDFTKNEWFMQVRESSSGKVLYEKEIDEEGFNTWNQARGKFLDDVLYYQSAKGKVVELRMIDGASRVLLDVERTVADWDVNGELLIYSQSTIEAEQDYSVYDSYLYVVEYN